MSLLVLVTTLAAGMVWQQYRAIQVEAAERARTQSAWILNGALDWARLILREDARSGGPDRLSEPWATPLAEARLSTFLAADKDNNADGGPDAFLSGAITDAQSRYNLRNLIDADNKIVESEFLTLQQLCEAANAPPTPRMRIAEGLRAAWATGETQADAAPIAPRTVAQLAWLGVDPAALERLETFIVLLPVRDPGQPQHGRRRGDRRGEPGVWTPAPRRRSCRRAARSPFKSMRGRAAVGTAAGARAKGCRHPVQLLRGPRQAATR